MTTGLVTGLGSRQDPPMPPVTLPGDGEASAGPPHGIRLGDYARIEARMAEGDRSIPSILQEERLSERAWQEVTLFWTSAIADDVRRSGADARLPHEYSAAFASAQDALGRAVAMDTVEYARLILEIQAHGDPHKPLARRRLSNADFLRLSRRMAALLSSEPVEAKRYAAALDGKVEPPISSAPVTAPQ